MIVFTRESKPKEPVLLYIDLLSSLSQKILSVCCNDTILTIILFGVTLNFKWARSTCCDEKIVSKKVFVHSEIKISDFLNWQTLSTVGELYLFYCRLVGDRDLSGVVTYNCTHSTSIETPFWLRFLIPHTTFTTLFFKPSQL